MNFSNTETQQTQTARTPKAMNIRDFHAAIGGIIGLNSLYALARSGKLKHVKIGNKILILSNEVENFFIREGGVN